MNTVAVPKLTTMSGAPKRSRPPIAAATRSAPTSDGFSVTTSHQTLRLRFQEMRRRTEEPLAGRFEHRIELRNDARNRDRVDRAALQIARGEELREEDAVLVGRATQLRRDAPRLLQHAVLETAEFRLGVADVDG